MGAEAGTPKQGRPAKAGTPNYASSIIAATDPSSPTSSTSKALPTPNRRDSPSEVLTSHSPVSTKNMARADEVCQSLRQPARTLMKRACDAGVGLDSSIKDADETKLVVKRSISISSK
jgi:hypothetical protein